MENQLATIETPLSAVQIRNQVNLIQEVMKEVMQEGQHYGKIPGCGDKPTLLKPGAEKLSMTFRLRPIIDNERDINIVELAGGHKEIRVYCHVMNASGLELATGVGSCSTMESKYRYRGGLKIFTGRDVPKNYWDLDKAGKKYEAKELIGGPGFGVGKNPESGKWEICEIGEKMENPDIADTYNTVLKMAKKRAYVDGILSATGASDIFTQDIEDMSPADLSKGTVVDAETTATGGKPAVQQPQEKAALTYSDIILLAQGKVGEVLNVSGYAISCKTRKVGEKKSDITDYTVGDLPKSHTAEIVISVWGLPIALDVGKTIKFNHVAIDEFKGAKKFLAKEVLHG